MRAAGKYRWRDIQAEQWPKSFSMLICLGLVVYLPPDWALPTPN